MGRIKSSLGERQKSPTTPPWLCQSFFLARSHWTIVALTSSSAPPQIFFPRLSPLFLFFTVFLPLIHHLHNGPLARIRITTTPRRAQGRCR